jgi:hypothetical protein
MPEMDLWNCRSSEGGSKPNILHVLPTAQVGSESPVNGIKLERRYPARPLDQRAEGLPNAGRRIVELQNELIAAREALAARAGDLEAANRDLEAFSYAVSSDLLKSLLAIGSHAHAIKELAYCKNDEQCSAYTKRIYDKIRHLGEIVGLMHDFFRPARSSSIGKRSI